MNEIIFEVTEDAEGGFTAEAIGESTFTQAESWNGLKANAREAVQAFYFDSTPPLYIRLHLNAWGSARAHVEHTIQRPLRRCEEFPSQVHIETARGR